MMRYTLFMLLILTTLTHALPRIAFTAVETLRLRYGVENIALGECGTAFSSDLSSVFYNPANATFYGLRNEVNLSFSGGFESLLPSLNISDIYRNDISAAIILPSLVGDFSFSFLYSFSNLNYGEITQFSPSGTYYGGTPPSDERVSAFLISSAWKDIISIGFSLKHCYSELSDFFPPSDTARGLAFDIGIRGQYRFKGNNRKYLLPGAGISFHNLGDSIYYTAQSEPDPIPRTLRTGLSLEAGITDVFWLAGMFDTKKLIAEGSDQPAVASWGMQVGLTPLVQLNTGFYLNDELFDQKELHWGITTGYRHRQFQSFLDYKRKREPAATSKNFHILYSFSMIHSLSDNDIRNQQVAHQLSCAFSLGKLNTF